MTRPNTDAIRAAFPALASPTIFLDNAGGSQLPGNVIEAAANYMRTSFVQGGADYSASLNVTATIAAARDFVSTFLNAHSRGQVLLGSSSTALLHTVANAYALAHARGELPPERNQIILCSAGHEANIGPWDNLAQRGFEILLWHPTRNHRGEWTITPDNLAPLLSPRTLLVAFPQVSNILGDIWDAKPICDLLRSRSIISVVDGVAFAPHQLPDVAALGCDWYVYSTYKVFGPHMGALFGTFEAFKPLIGPNHYFIDRAALAHKFELGGPSHEGCAMIAAGADYYRFLADSTPTPSTASARPTSLPHSLPAPIDRATLSRAFANIETIETPLQHQLISGLLALPGLCLFGPARTDASRVSTVAFTFANRRSRDITLHLNRKNLGAKHGHFYSKRLLEHLGVADPADGVIRISLSHYNTPGDVDSALAALREAINT